LNNYKILDIAQIDFNLRGKSWENPQGETIWFNTLQGWRIKKLNAAPSTESAVDKY